MSIHLSWKDDDACGKEAIDTQVSLIVSAKTSKGKLKKKIQCACVLRVDGPYSVAMKYLSLVSPKYFLSIEILRRLTRFCKSRLHGTLIVRCTSEDTSKCLYDDFCRRGSFKLQFITSLERDLLTYSNCSSSKVTSISGTRCSQYFKVTNAENFQHLDSSPSLIDQEF